MSATQLTEPLLNVATPQKCCTWMAFGVADLAPALASCQRVAQWSAILWCPSCQVELARAFCDSCMAGVEAGFCTHGPCGGAGEVRAVLPIGGAG